ncbi:MAG TPA: CBS domain-containing protein [Candidatus Limnocylindrales bacterium]|nr:CBS domain-containing protein [Candidatus Limnocylindrales bacterium]
MNVNLPGTALLVEDLMAKEPIVVLADASLSEAARLLDEYDISGLPVVAPDGGLVGVLSQTDLVRARATEWLWANWTGLHVRHLMTSPPVTIDRGASVEAAAIKMERQGVHRLVVVSHEDVTVPIGVISTSDLVRVLARSDR